DSKEQSGWYPREPPKKTIAMAYRISKKEANAVTKWIDKGLQEGAIRENPTVIHDSHLMNFRTDRITDPGYAFHPIPTPTDDTWDSPHTDRTIKKIMGQHNERLLSELYDKEDELRRKTSRIVRQIVSKEDNRGNLSRMIRAYPELYRTLRNQRYDEPLSFLDALELTKGIRSGQLTKVIAMMRKQTTGTRFPPPRLTYHGTSSRSNTQEPATRDTIVCRGTSSDITTSSEESDSESDTELTKLERRAEEQLTELEKFQGNKSDEDYDSDEPLAKQTHVDFSNDPMVLKQEAKEKEESRPPVRRDTNNQLLSFSGTSDVDAENRPIVSVIEKPLFGDDETLNPRHEFHYRIYWADCIHDECKFHNSLKEEHAFFPRRPR
ncbi:hypothetical protein LX36DRAFT_742991, partial [Colletotrichum falcatum]